MLILVASEGLSQDSLLEATELKNAFKRLSMGMAIHSEQMVGICDAD